MQGDREERIRRRAYDLWEREGKPEGRGDAHWAQACAEIDEEDRKSAGASSTDADTGVVKKVVRRTKKAAAEVLGAGLNAVVDVVEEALAPKKPRAGKAKDEKASAGKAKPAKAKSEPAKAEATKGEAIQAETATSEPAPSEPGKPAAKASTKKSQLPTVETGSHAVAKTEDMAGAEKLLKPARGKSAKADESKAEVGKPAGAKSRRKSSTGQNSEVLH
jgi:Protein of unknown function (DUF2934).